MDPRGANSEKGRELLNRFRTDAAYRAQVLENLRQGRYGPDYTLEDLNPAEQEFLRSGRWQRVSEQRLASMSEAEASWQ